jgi:hypothetical protein
VRLIATGHSDVRILAATNRRAGDSQDVLRAATNPGDQARRVLEQDLRRRAGRHRQARRASSSSRSCSRTSTAGWSMPRLRIAPSPPMSAWSTGGGALSGHGSSTGRVLGRGPDRGDAKPLNTPPPVMGAGATFERDPRHAVQIERAFVVLIGLPATGRVGRLRVARCILAAHEPPGDRTTGRPRALSA